MPSSDLPPASFVRWAPLLLIWLLTALALLAGWQHALGLIEADRERTEVDAQGDLVNLTRVSQEHAERTLQGVDQVLRQVIGQYHEHHGRIKLNQLDEQGVFDNHVLRRVDLLDAHGRLSQSTQPLRSPLDQSDRGYFKRQKAASDDSLAISHPEQERATGEWSLFLSRRITGSDGAFAGVVVAWLDPGYFARFYRELALGQHAVASLFGMDGAMLARRVGEREEFTGNVSASPLFTHLAQGEQAVTLTYVSISDGVERSYHFRKLPSYPLVVTVGMGVEDIFAAHREARASILQQAVLTSLLLLALTLGSSWYWLAHQRHVSAQARSLAALRVSAASADQANQAKSRFLAAASHDLRQPVAALTLYTSSLSRLAAPGQEKLLSHIRDSVASLRELLDDLLDISKLAAGVVTPHVSDFAIDPLLAKLVSVHAAQAQRKGIRLRMRASGSGVRTDETLLTRILANLIVNAIEFTERGGVLIACRRHAGQLRVEVWDSGKGFRQDQAQLIFEEFTQLDDGAEHRGSGLGLSIVAKTAALLELPVHVCSRPGRGSLFALTLPQAQAVTPTMAAVAAPLDHALRVALVDDNRLVRYALTLTLEGAGHEVIAAADTAELLQRLEYRAPDIVVSDYRLHAGETGFDVIAAVRGRFGSMLPAILVTGDTDPTLLRSMAARGIAVHYKPLQDEALLAAMRQAMGSTGSPT